MATIEQLAERLEWSLEYIEHLIECEECSPVSDCGCCTFECVDGATIRRDTADYFVS